MVDDRGRPVPDAVAEVRGGTGRFVADANGIASAVGTASSLNVVVKAAGHASTTAEVLAGEHRTVELRRILDLTVRVVDQRGGPVQGARVCLGLKRTECRHLWSSDSAPKAVSGEDGVAVLHDVAPGLWYIHADHELLVYAHEMQHGRDQYEGKVAVMPRDEEVTIRLAELCVVAVEVESTDILSSSFRLRGRSLRTASNRDGHFAVQRVRERLEAKFPKAAFWVKLVSDPNANLDTVDIGAVLWVAGRQPWRGTLHPVRLREFFAPTRIGLAEMELSNEFGSLMIDFVGASGTRLSGLNIQVLAAEQRSPLHLFGSTPFGLEEECDGQLFTLPTGSWRVFVNNPFLQSLSNERGVFQIEKGGFVERRIGQEFEWARCRLAASMEPSRAVAGSFAITHLDTGQSVTQRVDDLETGYSTWLPVGRLRLEVAGWVSSGDPTKLTQLRGQVEGTVQRSDANEQALIAPVSLVPN